MSKTRKELSRCPQCNEGHRVELFDSLNGHLLPDSTAQILSGDFEAVTCVACQHRWQPEHSMLYVNAIAGVWMIMFPPALRDRYASLEVQCLDVLAREFSRAPGPVNEMLKGARPRVVFGQRMLAEALRTAELGYDEVAVECLKMMVIREERLPLPSRVELCLDAVVDGQIVWGARIDGQDREGLLPKTPCERLEQIRETLPHFSKTHSELFRCAYISATRYFF